jgi:Mitochondrial ATP synthase epsilon chain
VASYGGRKRHTKLPSSLPPPAAKLQARFQLTFHSPTDKLANLKPTSTCLITAKMAFAWKAAGLTFVILPCFLQVIKLTGQSYNRYLAVAARVVRRSLKEDKRLQAERRGEMDLRFAKWEVSLPRGSLMRLGTAADQVTCRTESRGRTRVWGRPMQALWQMLLVKKRSRGRTIGAEK